MMLAAELLTPGLLLADGGTTIGIPHDHDTYVSVVVRYGNGEVRIRDFDRGYLVQVTSGNLLTSASDQAKMVPSGSQDGAGQDG